MSPARSAEEVLAAGPRVGSLPSVEHPFVCPVCLGPKAPEYPRCTGCHRIFLTAPPSIATHVVPISAVMNPSPYYNALLAYKNADSSKILFLAAIVALFLRRNLPNVQALLGGDVDVVAVVPSTRGKTFQTQPLVRVPRNVGVLLERVQPAVAYQPGVEIPRQEYTPTGFVSDPRIVGGRRVLLLEDSWASGCHPVSAAGAILLDGARSVVILAIARVYDVAFWGADHPYAAALKAPWDPARWPR